MHDKIKFIDQSTNRDSVTFTWCTDGSLEIDSIMFEDTIHVETLIYLSAESVDQLRTFVCES